MWLGHELQDAQAEGMRLRYEVPEGIWSLYDAIVPPARRAIRRDVNIPTQERDNQSMRSGNETILPPPPQQIRRDTNTPAESTDTLSIRSETDTILSIPPMSTDSTLTITTNETRRNGPTTIGSKKRMSTSSAQVTTAFTPRMSTDSRPTFDPNETRITLPLDDGSEMEPSLLEGPITRSFNNLIQLDSGLDQVSVPSDSSSVRTFGPKQSLKERDSLEVNHLGRILKDESQHSDDGSILLPQPGDSVVDTVTVRRRAMQAVGGRGSGRDNANEDAGTNGTGPATLK